MPRVAAQKVYTHPDQLGTDDFIPKGDSDQASTNARRRKGATKPKPITHEGQESLLLPANIKGMALHLEQVIQNTRDELIAAAIALKAEFTSRREQMQRIEKIRTGRQPYVALTLVVDPRPEGLRLDWFAYHHKQTGNAKRQIKKRMARREKGDPRTDLAMLRMNMKALEEPLVLEVEQRAEQIRRLWAATVKAHAALRPALPHIQAAPAPLF